MSNRTTRQDTLDCQPGAMPEIRTVVDGVTFEMRLVGIRQNERIVIRCDDTGEVWMSIHADEPDAESETRAPGDLS